MKTILRILGFLVSVVVLVANPMMFMFVCFAMLPAIVAYIVDRLPGKNTSTTVALFNFAGVSIFIMQFFGGSHTLGNIGQAISLQWILVVYLFAACGWFMIWILPKIVVSLSEYRIQHRIDMMEEKLSKLVEEWGEEVKG